MKPTPQDKRDAKRIVDAFYSAIAATNIYSPTAVRIAAEKIAADTVGDYWGEKTIATAYVAACQMIADRKEAEFRRQFGGENK